VRFHSRSSVKSRKAALLSAALAVSSIAARADTASTADSAPGWLTPNLGGDATLAIANENAYARAVPVLPTEDLRQFTFGNRLFNTNWVTAPASVDAFDGLGPVFNRVSCSGCHTRDGRGQPPAAGEPLESMLVRLSVPGQGEHGGVNPVPHYGDQLNEKAISAVPAEGRTVITYTERGGKYPDGTAYTLAEPSYRFVDLAFGALPERVLFSPRVAPPVFGLGLLEAVPEEEILAHADEQDADHDGVTGRANRVWDVISGETRLGRFGWKANQAGLRQQNASAALGDIGLTSRLFPRQNVAEGQIAAAAAPGGGDPELKDDFFEKLTFYTRVLAVPAARHTEDPLVRSGARLFEVIHCASCHRPTLRTGAYPDVPQLSNQVIHPFTDLLLHDMGPALADGRPDFLASGSEWRTPPLWGIGLTEVVNRHTRFLHDGRARSLEEAILWHGGEATAARDQFKALDAAQRAAVLEFLRNL
jgi:CxxC motif-containing protein (DUF1111 family)